MKIILVREIYCEPGELSLMSHQAIHGIARCILARQSRYGLNLSEHRIIAPADLDILPLLAHIADDYSDFIEPESESTLLRRPIILYGNIRRHEEEMINQFLNPRWFESRVGMTLNDVVTEFQPEVCAAIGSISSVIESFDNIDCRFSRGIIGFSNFIQNINNAKRVLENRFNSEVIIADEMLNNVIIEARSGWDLPDSNPAIAGVWSSLYQDSEQLPDLEPFVAFGPAFEMALFRQAQRNN